ncbi:hypothetical protein NL676_004324 [Syzygium grande]|nr:hypothetical protein NL676_004324 [Syzygium grande]
MPAYKDAVYPDVLRKWEDEYVIEVISTGSVCRLLTAANHLNIPELLDRLNLYWLKSFEGQVFEIHEDVSLQSPLVSNQAKEAGGVIQLEGADTKSLRKVIVWCKGRTPAYKAAILSELLIAAAALAIAEKDPVEKRRQVLAGTWGGRSL